MARDHDMKQQLGSQLRKTRDLSLRVPMSSKSVTLRQDFSPRLCGFLSQRQNPLVSARAFGFSCLTSLLPPRPRDARSLIGANLGALGSITLMGAGHVAHS
eukprot:3363130-Rhodomonas_salina.2